MNGKKIPWSKAVNGQAKKRIKDLGETLEAALYAGGITTIDHLRSKRTKTARIIAQVFSAEVYQLESFADQYIEDSIPDLSEILDGSK